MCASIKSYVTKSVMKKKELEFRAKAAEAAASCCSKYDILFKKNVINLKYDQIEGDNAKNVGCLSVYSSRCCVL